MIFARCGREPAMSGVRNRGVNGLGGAPWGMHGCLFYETKQDLLDTLVPFFKTGLEHGEACLWIVSEPLTLEEAGQALRQAVPEIDRYLGEQSIELSSSTGWCFEGGTDDLRRIIGHLNDKLAEAMARGYTRSEEHTPELQSPTH